MGNQATAFAMLFLAVTVILSGCAGANEDNTLPESRYVALGETISGTGHIVEGSYPYPGMAQPPLGFFDYKNPRGYLADEAVNDSLEILHGLRQHMESEVKLTESLIVTGIYSYPCQTGSGPVITGADKNGTVYLAYDNETIPLKVGQTWSREAIVYEVHDPGGYYQATENNVTYVTQTLPGGNNSGNYTYVTSGLHYVLRFNMTYEITNLGIYDKPIHGNS